MPELLWQLYFNNSFSLNKLRIFRELLNHLRLYLEVFKVVKVETFVESCGFEHLTVPGAVATPIRNFLFLRGLYTCKIEKKKNL